MIAETASAETGGHKAGWISDALATRIPRSFTAVKAVVWFNNKKETNWHVESSHAALAAFANAIANPIYASNQFAGLNNSPMPCTSSHS